jgi:Zn-dependent protease with chaperone function
VGELFPPEEVERGRRYHRPRYLSFVVDFVVTIAVLAVLAFTDAGDALLPNWNWWAQALVYPAIVLGVLSLVQLPVAYWRGYLHERRWELSTQAAGGWLVDRLKGFLISVVISSALFVGFVALARATGAWPLIAAPLAALVVVFLSFIAPVVFEPIFNKFKPLSDEELADDLRALSVRAGVPVRDVLVADASRRTRKSNAYVSGFGATRRVVLFDTMLEQADPAALRAVLAHELAHRRHRDVLNLTIIAVAAAIGAVLLLWALLGSDAGDPRSFPVIVLVLLLVQPAFFALVAAISRRWEYRADRFALLLTRDPGALERAFRGLVETNVADLDPPRVVYYLQYTHPTVPERLEALRRTATVEGIRGEEAA